MNYGNVLNNGLDNFDLNKIEENKDKIIEYKKSDFQNKNLTKKFAKEVFIIKKEDFDFLMQFEGMFKDDNNDNKSLNSPTLAGFNNEIKIISSIEDVEKLIQNNIEFLFLNKEFFQDKSNIQGVNTGEGVIFFESENRKYLIFPKEKDKNNVLEISNRNIYSLIQQHLDNISFINQGNNPSNNINIVNLNKAHETKEMIILKKLILLYAFEKHLIQLINSPIKDEYDINEYYLINKDWINDYKTKFNYQKITKILDDMKLTYSYKGYCINLDEILDKIKSNKNNYNILFNLNNIETSHNNMINILSKEKEFFPLINENKISFNESTKFPIDFILVPENYLIYSLKVLHLRIQKRISNIMF